MKRKIFIGIAIFLILISLGSCASIAKGKLQGTWKTDDGKITLIIALEKYTFTNDNISQTELGTIDVSKKYIVFTPESGNAYTCGYKIKGLKNMTLTLTGAKELTLKKQ